MESKTKNMETIVILLAVGLAAGMLSGFVGLGGGIIVIPALVLLLGMSQHQASGTSLAMMLPPIGILAVLNYYKKGFVDVKAAVILCVFFVVGSYFGSKLAISLPEATVRKVFGVIVLAISLKMIFGK